MNSAIVEHEFYCSSYAAKEQPQLKELLGAMHTSLQSLDQAMEERERQGLTMPNMDLAAKVLHRLVSATKNVAIKVFLRLLVTLRSNPTFTAPIRSQTCTSSTYKIMQSHWLRNSLTRDKGRSQQMLLSTLYAQSGCMLITIDPV